MRQKQYLAILLAILAGAQLSGCGITMDNTRPESTNEAAANETAADGEWEKLEETDREAPSADAPQASGEASENKQEAPAQEVAQDAEALYKDVLANFHALVAYGLDENVDPEGTTGVLELVNASGCDYALRTVGSVIKDLNGDAVPELLIGNCNSNEIYALYTLVEETPVLCFEGYARNRYYLLEDGSIYNLSSGGAMYSAAAVYTLSEDATALVCKDFYFTYEKDDSFEEIGVYYNQTGEWDKEVSQETELSSEQFWELTDAWDAQIQRLPIESAFDGSVPFDGISIAWAEDILPELTDYDEFAASTDEGSVRVVLSTERDVEDFKVLSLALENVDENGTATFAKEELYSHGTLTAEKPLVLSVIFYGTVPYYGISFTDDNGETKVYAIDESGMDGSVYLWEIE